MTRLHTWTVFGLLDLDQSPSPLYVAGVVEGEHTCQDSDSNSGECGELQRYATTVEAADADEAAAIAERQALTGDEEESDEEPPAQTT
ncbi:hypothetical protein ABZ897_16045 [Nonomuraea sp. NPDC046802]|uniref:hypothetical protein n=1 Tax=Nonomuraea sp. NPDC046802 TaxID=3154919 RepID=UPI0033DB23C7